MKNSKYFVQCGLLALSVSSLQNAEAASPMEDFLGKAFASGETDFKSYNQLKVHCSAMDLSSGDGYRSIFSAPMNFMQRGSDFEMIMDGPPLLLSQTANGLESSEIDGGRYTSRIVSKSPFVQILRVEFSAQPEQTGLPYMVCTDLSLATEGPGGSYEGTQPLANYVDAVFTSTTVQVTEGHNGTYQCESFSFFSLSSNSSELQKSELTLAAKGDLFKVTSKDNQPDTLVLKNGYLVGTMNKSDPTTTVIRALSPDQIILEASIGAPAGVDADHAAPVRRWPYPSSKLVPGNYVAAYSVCKK